MQRRRKIHARPNVATASIAIRPNAEMDVKSPSIQAAINSGDEQLPQTNLNSPASSPANRPQTPNFPANVDNSGGHSQPSSPVKIPTIIRSPLKDEQQQMQSSRPQTPLMAELERPTTGFRPPSTPAPPSTAGDPSNLHQIVQQRMSNNSEAVEEMMMAAEEPNEQLGPQNKRRREPLKDKLCDTKKFTMADLVNWRPKTENTLRKKWAEKRKALRESMEREGGTEEGGPNNLVGENAATSSSKATTHQQPAGPRVKINERGEIVVDEESLVLVTNPENNALETIQDDFMPKKLTSMSFRKNAKRSSIWGVMETDLFYEVLAATGTDFGLMHEFIQSRSRAELKQKYNREERLNPTRLDETLRHPVLLDERLKQRVERILGEIETKKTNKSNENKNLD